jgi:WD40 repeat protein
VSQACYSPDGEKILSAAYDKTLRVWASATGELLHILQDQKIVEPPKAPGVTYFPPAPESPGRFCCIFSAGGTHILSESGGYLQIWDAATGEIKMTWRAHIKALYCICISSDGNTIATGSEDTTLKLWEASTGHYIDTLQGGSGAIYSACFSEDGSTIISTSGNTVQVWS